MQNTNVKFIGIISPSVIPLKVSTFEIRHPEIVQDLTTKEYYYLRDVVKIGDFEANTESTFDTDFEMILVEGGTFQMGDKDISDATPHPVTLDDFWIGKYPVTQAQWKAVMGNNPSHFKGKNLPVERVSWNGIQVFLKKLNQATGKKYRLPTEEEWEYAARGGNKSKGYKYAGSNNLDEVAWYDKNSGSKTHAVGSKKANELGLYDMTGNVWEWTNSGWSDNYINNRAKNRFVLRGGSWYDNPNYLRVAVRSWDAPSDRSFNLGFRLCQVL